MTEIIKASRIEVSKNDKGELLLRVQFKSLEGGGEYSWMPQWETLRDLIFSAIAVEAFNRHDSHELELFGRCLNACGIVKDRLFHLFGGDLGREGDASKRD
jgi:hypothetical protein